MKKLKLTLRANYNDQDVYLKAIKQLEALGWEEVSGKAILDEHEVIKSFESKFTKDCVK